MAKTLKVRLLENLKVSGTLTHSAGKVFHGTLEELPDEISKAVEVEERFIEVIEVPQQFITEVPPDKNISEKEEEAGTHQDSTETTSEGETTSETEKDGTDDFEVSGDSSEKEPETEKKSEPDKKPVRVRKTRQRKLSSK